MRGDRLTSARSLPRFIGRPGPTAWHGLNPLTKLVLALATTVAAIILDGPACLLALGILAVVVPAGLARQLAPLLRTSLLLALPVAVSAALVNVLFGPAAGTPVLELGPVRVTEEGLRLAAVVVVRVLVMAGAVTLFYRATTTAELVADLERRGLRPGATFFVASAVSAIPDLATRAATVTAAQRARGLDTEGGAASRARGLLPLVGPVMAASIAEAEARAMAIEARAFSRPSRRTVLWAPGDSTLQRLARWLATLALAALVAGRLLGAGLPC